MTLLERLQQRTVRARCVALPSPPARANRFAVMRLHRVALLAVTAAIVAGCQPPDVGERCDVQWNRSPSNPIEAPEPATVPGDYLETGNLACDSLVCIVSPAPSGEYSSCAGDHTQCGYCSKPCVSDAECFKSETGLVCRQIVLDPEFILLLEQQDEANGTNIAGQFLGDARYSRYCAAPL
jgi:hypothetical protein